MRASLSTNLTLSVIWHAVPQYTTEKLAAAAHAADKEGRLQYRQPLVSYTNRFGPTAETVWISPQVEAITDIPTEQWLGQPGFLDGILHPDDRDSVLADMKVSRDELRPFSRDYRLTTPSGETVWIHDESVPVLDKHGQPEFIQGYFVDQTERKALEAHLHHAQKTETLGRMTSAIVHDFNNHLTAILGYAQPIRRALAEDTEWRRDLDQVVETGERARALIRQLRAFSRREPLEPRPTSPDQVLEELAPMLRQIAGSSVELELVLSEAPLVYIDPGQLEQVLVNLVSNARDAMPDGGSITIRSGQSGDYAELTVADTGSGMDAETAARVFEPYFTTKERNAGTGLGLATVDRIVRGSGGTVDVSTR